MSRSKFSEIWFRDQFKEQLRSLVLIVGILILVTSTISILVSGGFYWERIKNWAFYSVYYGFVLSLINGMVIDGLDHYFPWEVNAKKRALYGFFGQISISLVTIFLLNIILWVFIYGYPWNTVWHESNRSFYLIALIITVIISLTYHSIYFFKEIQEEKRKSAELEKEKVKSELYNLRAHMDPHFLFNSLNVLSGLIDEDRDKAQEFLAALSRLYRHILEKQGETLTTVREELVFARSYMGLYKSRFEDAISYEVNLAPEHESQLLPSLSLQMLIENAIKHNAFDREHPLQLSIQSKGDHLVVCNNKRSKPQIEESTRKSLINIRSRYALLGKDSFEVQDRAETFVVRLPLIQPSKKTKP